MRRYLPALADHAVIALVWAGVVRALLAPHVVFGHSAYIDLVRQVAVEHSLRTRWTFPGWVPEFYLGYGSPIFLFYAPLPYLLSGLAAVAGAGAVLGLKLVYAAGVLGAGITMYRLVRGLLGRPPALAAAALYMTAPYLLVDLYARSAIGEVVALALAPELCGSLLRLARTGRARHLAAGALCLAALVLAHNIAALLLVPAAGLLAAVIVARGRGAQAAALVAGTFVFGLLLSAFFWVPAIAEKDLVRSEEGLTTGFFDYARHFVRPQDFLAGFPERAETPDRPSAIVYARVGRLHLVLFLVGLAAALAGRTAARREVLLFAALALAAAGFMLPASAPLWERLPLVRFVQFPWRFMLPVTLAVAPVCAAAVARAGAWRPGAERIAALVTVCFAVAYYVPQARAWYLLHDVATNKPVPVDRATIEDPAAWEGRLARPEEVLTIETMRHLGITSTAQDDYLPIWVRRLPARPAVRLYDTARGEVHVTPQDPRGERFPYDVDARTAGTLRWQVFYFPGWKARVGSRVVDAYPEEGSGLVLVDVPQGRFPLTLFFGPSPVRLAARRASLAGALGLVLSCTALAWRNRARGTVAR